MSPINKTTYLLCQDVGTICEAVKYRLTAGRRTINDLYGFCCLLSIYNEPTEYYIRGHVYNTTPLSLYSVLVSGHRTPEPVQLMAAISPHNWLIVSLCGAPHDVNIIDSHFRLLLIQPMVHPALGRDLWSQITILYFAVIQELSNRVSEIRLAPL